MSNTPVNSDPEKTAGLNVNTSNLNGGHYSHIKHARERLQHFLHPNGKRIHVVESPQDEVNLRRKLEHARREDENDEFDIYISGSPEHLEALREAHAHHSDKREKLRDEHQEMFDRFSDVHYELDALSHELDRVTSQGVSLEAHFSKFGYSAHIKTYDDDSPSGSGTSTPRSSISGKSESKCEKGFGKPLKLFKVPVVRQYFHQGTLWRSAGSEEVQSFELFVDLLYVGIIAINGDATSEEPTAHSLLQFIITFTLSWKIWNDMTLVISWFETDDIFQRVSILALLAMLFGYTTNITMAFEAAEGAEGAEGTEVTGHIGATYATLIGFYLAARLFMATYLILVAILVPMIRNTMIWYACLALVGAAFWIGSIHMSYPDQLSLIWVALAVDLCGQFVYILLRFATQHLGPKANSWMESKFEFWPAVNIEHRTERMNAFVTLVFGYSVVALLYQSTVNGVDAHYGKAVLGLTQAFCFNWMYFEVDGSNLHVHAIRRHRWSALAWTFAHLPFIMAYVLGGSGLSKLVLAVDTENSHLDALTETYKHRAEEEVPMGIRWFYCAGFAIALAFMGCISTTHVHKHSPTLRFKKRWRLLGRFCIAIIILLLPLAESLNSLELVGTVTALIIFALGLEMWAAGCRKEKLCQRSQPCKYIGHCQKKDLERMVKRGENVDISALSGDRTKNSGLTVLH